MILQPAPPRPITATVGLDASLISVNSAIILEV
jgi:hypothetical protein